MKKSAAIIYVNDTTARVTKAFQKNTCIFGTEEFKLWREYHDKFHELEDKGYLVNTHGNTYVFYEVPQAEVHTKNSMTADGLDFEEYPSSDTPI